MKKVSRPLSSAASFFRKNGGSGGASHRSIPRPVPTAMASAVSGLNSTPEELSHLTNTVLPLLVNFLGREALALDGLFVQDPSASSQEAMMGLTDPSQREPVRALRELLDSRFAGGSEASILRQHHAYVWGIALKLLLKELVAKKLPVLTPVAVGLLEESASKPDRLDFLQQRRFADFVSQAVANLFHVLEACRTGKEKLAFVFCVLLFGGEQQNVEEMSKTTRFVIENAEEIFGPSPFERVSSSSGGAPAFAASASPVYKPLQATAAPAAPANCLFKATCTFDFDPENEDELELRVGDEIEVLECVDEEWFKGRLRLPDGIVEEGLFPSAFVKRDTPVPQQQQQQQQFVPPPPPPPPAPAVAPPPLQDLFISAPPPPPPPPAMPAQALAAPPPPQPQVATLPAAGSALGEVVAVALFDFTAEEEGELQLSKGERLVILDQTDPDWWLGRRVSDGVQGLFPFNYANIISTGAAVAATTSSAFSQVPFVAEAPPVVQVPTPAPAAASFLPPPLPPGKPVASGPPTTTPADTSVKAKAQRSSSGSARPRPPPPPNPTNIVLPPGKAPVAKPAPVINTTNYSRPQEPPASPPIPLAVPDPAANGWMVTADAYNKYMNFFKEQPNKEAGGTKVPGKDMANFLVQSGLPKATIAQILELSDLDRDQRFDADEFALAMHLALCISKRNMPVPSKLPAYLVPSTKRHLQ